MSFFDKAKKALKKIKTKLIVFFIMFLVICVWGVAPFARALVNNQNDIIEYNNTTGSPVPAEPEEIEALIANGEMQRDEGMALFITTLLLGLSHPLTAFLKCIQVEPINYLATYSKGVLYTGCVALFAAFVGFVKAWPKYEYEDIENGSSDWCENGEQYAVLNKRKGIVLAEKNYLPVDKRGNVNVLVVRRFWCW